MSKTDTRYAYDVFISYPHDQAELAARLHKELAARGLGGRPVQVWRDANRLKAGATLMQDCVQAAEASRHLLWIVTEASRTSGYQKYEVAAFTDVTGERKVLQVQVGKWRSPSLRHLDLLHIDATNRGLTHDDIVAEVLDALSIDVGEAADTSVTLVRWLACVRADHARLIPWLGGPGALDLDRVVVDPGVCAVGRASYPGRVESPKRPGAVRRFEDELDGLGIERGGSVKLRELLGPGRRLVLWGEPGCGKTTLFRHLAHHLASDPGGPVPVFVALAGEQRARAPFAIAAERLGVPLEGRSAATQALRRAAQGHRYPVFLLDGLDEVPIDRLHATTDWIATLPEGAAVLVSSRQQLQKSVDLPGFVEVEVKELSDEQQLLLLAILLKEQPDEVATLAGLLKSDAQLRKLARNPLLLTLLAVLTRDDPDGAEALPRFRGDLFESATALLLRRGHGVVEAGEAVSVRNPDAARALLAKLAFALHGTRSEAWKRQSVFDRIWTLREQDPLFAKLQDAYWRPGEQPDLLDDLAANSGVFGPLDGPQARWRFLHRTFREYLSAADLAARYSDDPAGLMAWVREHGEDIRIGLERKAGRAAADGPESRWGEVHAFLVGLVEDPEPLMEPFADIGGGVGLRAVLGAKGLERSEAARALLLQRDLEYEALESMTAGWAEDPDEVAQLLLGAVSPEVPPQALGMVWFALEQLTGEAPEREAFFTQAGRWPEGGPQAPETVDIPAGSFVMGCTKEEQARFGGNWGYERPPHPVTLTRPYRLGVTPVTQAEYAVFDKDWGGGPRFAATAPRHPIHGVSWWEAYAYCRWVGGSLPTEAEWECACRAGTSTAFWSGDTKEDLLRVAWVEENSEAKLRTVGGKPANPWGLHDMHGLVWEWCEDSARTYDGQPTTDPRGGGPPAGTRVLRGGSFGNFPDVARSAYRIDDSPSLRVVGLGFRVRLPPALERGSMEP